LPPSTREVTAPETGWPDGDIAVKPVEKVSFSLFIHGRKPVMVMFV